MLEMQKQWADQKKKELEVREEKRHEIMKLQMIEKQKESLKQRENKEAKLKSAKENLNSIIESQRKGFQLKQEETELKRKKIEEERERARQEAQRKADIKAQELKKVQELNIAIEEKRRNDLLKAEREANERTQKLQKLKEEEIIKKKQEEELKQLQHDHVRHRMQEITSTRIEKIKEKLTDEEIKLKKIKEKKDHDLVVKRELDDMKRSDRQENVIRIERQQQYYREKILERINEDSNKVELRKRAKEELMAERKKVKDHAEAEKQKMMSMFEDLKKKKGSINEYAEKILSSKSQQVSVNEKLGNSSYVKPAEKKKYIESPNIKSSLPKEKKPNYEIKKIVDLKQERENLLAALKEKNKKEMIDILDREDAKEQEREKQIKLINNEEERNNIDQKFGIERAIACDAITKLAKKHRKAEQTLANKLGILNSSHYL